jgi:hypothetical protein
MDIKDKAQAEADQTSSGELQWMSPGVSVRKRWLTALGVALASIVFFGVALSQGASMLVSSVIGVVFIGCFIWYLVIVAPTPFRITVDEQNLSRFDRGGETVTIPWSGIAKIKEEVFKNGTSVSITVYKRVGERGLHRSWVAYRDDLPGFDSLVGAVRDHLPEDVSWYREQVHQ